MTFRTAFSVAQSKALRKKLNTFLAVTRQGLQGASRDYRIE